MPAFSVSIRIVLFSITTLLAIGLGFFLPERWLAPAFHHSGYYFMFFAVFLWGILIIHALKNDFLLQIKKNAPALLLAIVLMGFIFHMSPPKFKILADETNLISISMAMHFNKTVSMPVAGLAVEYLPFDYHRQSINPRPLLYPFVVSLFHAVLGYNPYNGIMVNFFVGVGILFSIYLLFSLVFSRFFGFVAMIIVASFPIFIFWVTSSGFEAINLFFAIVVILGLFYFLKQQEVKYAEIIMFSLVLLANCRYESALFILPLLLSAPWFLNRQIILKYRFYVLCLPLCFLPLAWQRQISFLNPLVRGDAGIQTPDHLFSIAGFLDNVARNIFVLTGLDADYGFLLLIFIAAVSGIYISIKKLLFSPHSISPANRTAGLYIGVSGLLLFVFYTSFFWGQFTTSINNRLAMVLLPFIVFPAVYFLHRRFSPLARPTKFLLLFLLLAQMVYYWPIAGAQHLLHQNALHYVNERVTHYLYQQYDLKNEKLLLISDRPNLYVIHGIGSIGFKDAVQQQKKINTLDKIYFDQILVLQKCDPITGEVHPDNRLNDSFRLRKISRINVSPDYYLRISSVTSHNPSRSLK